MRDCTTESKGFSSHHSTTDFATRTKRIKFLVYLEVANNHRNTIVAALARTILSSGHDIRIACERRVAYQLENSSPVQLELDESIDLHYSGDLEKIVEKIDILSFNNDSISEAACKRRSNAIVSLVEGYQPDRVILWNGNFAYQKATNLTLEALGYKDRILFLEVAWFSQREFIYFDTKGVNLYSSICGRTPEPLTSLQSMRLEQWYERQRSSRVRMEDELRRPGPLRIFVPLQVDTDTSIREGSPFSDMRSFVSFLETWVPPDSEVILKAHPKAHYPYLLGSKQRNFHFRASGSIDELMNDADVVLGVNSTVLLEAASFGKRVVAFGRGLFTGCQVITEATPDDDSSEIFSRPINRAARASFFYHLVFDRQVSIEQLKRQNAAHLFSRYPFSEFPIAPSWVSRIFCINAQEGKSMIKVGKSKIARTASLDVEKGGQISIGDDSEVRHHAVLEVSGRYNGSIEIGNHSVVGVGNWLQGSGSIKIGNDVIIGPYVAIVSTNHSYDDTSKPVAQQPLRTGEVVIEDDVWIGAHCTIAQNVRIGAHSIIGANSFVNKDVPPYSVAVGAPAKVIKSRK